GCCEVHHGVDGVLLESSEHDVRLGDVGSYEARSGRHGGSVAGREVIEDDDTMTVFEKRRRRDAADVTCATGDEDVQPVESTVGSVYACTACQSPVCHAGTSRQEAVMTVQPKSAPASTTALDAGLIYLNGSLVPQEQATVSVLTHALDRKSTRLNSSHVKNSYA